MNAVTRIPTPPQVPMGMVIGVVAFMGLAFQVGHFAEHAFQFVVWLLGDFSSICGRDTPWMSPVAIWLVQWLSSVFFPAEAGARSMMLGMEILHLIGNSIFLLGLGALYYCVRLKWVRWALYIECFHSYEHLMLLVSAIFIGKPIGMSTLFGASFALDKEATVGIRVTWHFLMNLLPMPFAMIGIMQHSRWSRRVPPSGSDALLPSRLPVAS